MIILRTWNGIKFKYISEVTFVFKTNVGVSLALVLILNSISESLLPMYNIRCPLLRIIMKCETNLELETTLRKILHEGSAYIANSPLVDRSGAATTGW